MNEPPLATLIITTRNRKEELLEAIASALTQTVPLEIIVFDDVSTDGTPEAIAMAFPSVRVVRGDARRGYIRLRNLGAKLASAPIIFSIDDDAVFTTPRIVEQVLEEFDNPRVGAVAIPFMDVKISPRVRQQAPGGADIYAAAMFIGTAHALRKELFLRLGGYREFFEHQFEEPDYCIRMLAAGYVVRLGRSDVIKHFMSPRRDYSRMHFYSARNNILLHWCNVPWPNVIWRMLRTTGGQLFDGLRHGAVGVKLQGVAAGWRQIPRYWRERDPISAGCYRVLRGLAAGPVPLANIAPMLARIAPAKPINGKIRIAWLIKGDEGGGVAQAVRGLAAAAAPLGVTPVMLSFSDGPFAQECALRGWEVRSMNLEPPPGLVGSPVHKVFTYLRLRHRTAEIAPAVAKAVRDCGAQVLHVLWPNLVPLAGKASQLAGARCIWEMPNVMSKFPLALNRRVLRYALDQYGIIALANSRYTLESLGQRTKAAILFYLGADAIRFYPRHTDAVTRSELSIPTEAIVLGILARLSKEKGQNVVLAAMAALVPKHNLHLLLLGGPLGTPFHQELLVEARSLGIESRVHFMGEVPDPERYYDVIDLPINSRIDAEPFGLSVVEAMMAGKPVLVHALGGPAETVLDGVTGWHIGDPAVTGFRGGLERAIADKAKWPQMGEAARQLALDHFNLNDEAKRYVEIIHRGRMGKNR